jgi:1-aminocyclopropane-1-carboxylate deaminase
MILFDNDRTRLTAIMMVYVTSFCRYSSCLLRCCPSRSPSIRLYSELDDLMTQVVENEDLFTDIYSDNSTCASSYSTLKNSKDGWRIIDWNKEAVGVLSDESKWTQPSSVDVTVIQDRLVYVKRDDHLRLQGSQIAGNKARKMLALNNLKDFPLCVVSYGGPQSNAMVALAAVVNFQNIKQGIDDHHDPHRCRFIYYTKKLPKFLRNQPTGNLFRAKMLGIEMIELPPEEYRTLFGGKWGANTHAPQGLTPPVPGDSLWIPQGGSSGMAHAGTRLLAQEICEFWSLKGNGRPLSVAIPGGTCSTAVLVHTAIESLQSKLSNDKQMDIKVVVIPCIGDDTYARRQMMALNTQLGNASNDLPTILKPSPFDLATQQNHKHSDKYFTFGEPEKDILETFVYIKEKCDITLDLLYGAPAWAVLLRHWKGKQTSPSVFDANAPFADRSVMYVHSGGIEGVNTQLLRYRYKGLLKTKDVQLPNH